VLGFPSFATAEKWNSRCKASSQNCAKKPRVLFIANPNNPTGTLFGFKELERILRAATHTAVVMDEAYAEFSAFTAVPWIRKFPHCLSLERFQKSPGLPPCGSARSSPAKSLSPWCGAPCRPFR